MSPGGEVWRSSAVRHGVDAGRKIGDLAFFVLNVGFALVIDDMTLRPIIGNKAAE